MIREALYLIALFTVGLLGADCCRAEDNRADSQTTVEANSSRSLSFNEDVRPLLSNHCIFCHGPDAESRQADLRLDIEGNVDLEEVLARIESTDEDEIMPPPEAHKPLKPQQIEILKRWIKEGGQYQTHWSFSPIQPQDIPSVEFRRWNGNFIDSFVSARLNAQKLQPSEGADRRTLLRRLSFDLTGLPPTSAEIRQFLEDDSAEAYQNQVDRLLASDRFGEHQARYWLDIVRFADTNGLHHDHYRDMTPYRDWVIDSFNENMPFDQFTQWQIAGDLFESPTREQLIASGFNRLHLIIDAGTALPEESFNRNVVDRVSAVGTAFMGLTLQCASCHDHKFDPISQQEFYQLYAFFNNIAAGPETGGRDGNAFRRGLQPPYVDLTNEHQDELLADLHQQIQAVESELKKLKEAADGIEEGSKEGKGGGEEGGEGKSAIADLNLELKRLREAETKLLLQIPAAMVMKERGEVRPAHILERGVYDQKGAQVQRNTPAFLPPLVKEKDDGKNVRTRLDFARWLTAAENPLTARVTVNRIWQQLFGVGLVKTSEDFGAQGETPRYRKLLDQLAVEFIESGWDVKRLIRNIVMSQTYQQTSSAASEAFQTDPENRWLARGARYRIDAEMVRDQILQVTGVLDTTMKGKSVKPPQPDGLWKLVTMPDSNPRSFEADKGTAIYRRSVYTFWKRGLPPTQMTIFDAPTRESCIARRERTNTPLQALVLMNETEYFRITLNYAARLLSEPTPEDKMLDRVYESVTARSLNQATRRQLKTALEIFRKKYQQQPELADQMRENYLEDADPGKIKSTELSAWTMLIHSLFNLDITKTRE